MGKALKEAKIAMSDALSNETTASEGNFLGDKDHVTLGKLGAQQ